MMNLNENKYIKDILNVYMEENIIKSYDITVIDKISVTVCDGVEPSEIEEMLIGALYIAYDSESYYIDIEVIK